jgi:3-hydroxy-D-aspartate aldolase
MWNFWRPALFLLSTVMSRRLPTDESDGWLVIDSGLKAQSTDSGLPTVFASAQDYETASIAGRHIEYRADTGAFDSSVGALVVKSVSDEHSTLIPRTFAAQAAVRDTNLGDKLVLVPGHCDPFVNHYDWMVGVRKGRVETVWRLGARSPGQ